METERREIGIKKRRKEKETIKVELKTNLWK
jgi:hypothetical protein